MQKEAKQLKKLWKIFDSIEGGIAERFGTILLFSGHLEHESDIRVYEEALVELGLEPITKKAKRGKKVLIVKNFSKKVIDEAEIKE